MAGYTAPCTEAAGFAEAEQWRCDWERVHTRDKRLDQLPTQGAFTRTPRAALEEVLAGIGAAIDAAGGSFTMHYATAAVTALRAGTRRRDHPPAPVPTAIPPRPGSHSGPALSTRARFRGPHTLPPRGSTRLPGGSDPP
ncbi:hypothetical protein [Streptomyces qinglanensis]|uniref:hypothetical protein n=1 Tax=Streptomyces qinglanensis TaxID=943816 RepID=UPI003D703DC8